MKYTIDRNTGERIQLQSERTDPTGRWSPVDDTSPPEPLWVQILGGVVIGAVIGALIVWGVSA